MIKRFKKDKFMGLDVSINGTGLVILDSELKIIYYAHYKYKQSSNTYIIETSEGVESIPVKNNNKFLKASTVRDHVRLAIEKYTPKVGIENYAYNGNGLVFQIAEFTGVLKTLVYETVGKLNLFDIKTLKKKITGLGSANKLQVMMGLDREIGFSFGENDDLNDAYVVALALAKRI